MDVCNSTEKNFKKDTPILVLYISVIEGICRPNIEIYSDNRLGHGTVDPDTNRVDDIPVNPNDILSMSNDKKQRMVAYRALL